MNFSIAYYYGQCCGSGINIPDPNFFLPGSRICIKEFKYFIQKNWFLSSRKYHPGSSSKIRIQDPDPYFLPFPDPGVKKAPDPGSGTATLIVQK
jgi:hypothetical protein